jgi:hypothetical protein
MSRSIDYHVREQIITDCLAGLSYSELSRKYTINYGTIKTYHERYLAEGMQGLVPHYSNCGKHMPERSNLAFRASSFLKRIHPLWGAPFIKIKLQERYPDLVLPAVRTLQKWFKFQGLNVLKTRIPNPLDQWAKQPHETWQIDAKERIVLADQTQGCWLTIVDEKSGATLATLVFPPQQDMPSSH